MYVFRDRFHAQAREPCFKTRRLNVREAHCVHARSARVRASVGVAQDVFPIKSCLSARRGRRQAPPSPLRNSLSERS
jgi:hypothetical protein